ncbi:uncharacterized protein PV09_04187 [Verruconis gallopava]|uniref:Cytochrome b2, mitochondrial n=1 Tax=Verruconis gallopava TaxID=253628 RepID=A0A0D1XQW2_9PEZI|nr:uncharacterized protein PV09_04187 [Verruconis gallopava]KIW05031.1 hypothetical protein PV09_04187 [Verruconis gallopava]
MPLSSKTEEHKMLSISDVAKHNSKESCWIIIAGRVYDVTDFVDAHPGGPGVILRYAGKDATLEYEPIHPAGTIEKNIPKDRHLGPVAIERSFIESLKQRPETSPSLPEVLPLSACKSLLDLRIVAEKKLTPKARVYFQSAVETFSALRANDKQWKNVSFRPRVLRNVSKVSMKCEIMGVDSSLPIFIAPAAMAGLGHPDGERCLARGATRMAIPQCVATYASVAHEDIVSSWTTDPGRRGSAPVFQLYVPRQKKDARDLILKAKSLGFKALVVTVDSPVIGKRDDDDQFKALQDLEAGVQSPSNILAPLPGQEADTLRGLHCSDFEWSDLIWVREIWGDKPIILKGIQTAEDALYATQYDINGIYLSNHGGRQLDYAPGSLETLLEIKKYCPEVVKKVEVYLDGGVWRGSDVVKALCLGARAVGLGRGFMFALSAYGTEGVIKAIQILSDEIQTTMRLLGVTDISELNESYVNTVRLERKLFSARI